MCWNTQAGEVEGRLQSNDSPENQPNIRKKLWGAHSSVVRALHPRPKGRGFSHKMDKIFFFIYHSNRISGKKVALLGDLDLVVTSNC